MFLRIFTVFLVIFTFSSAKSEIFINNFDKKTKITPQGRQVDVKIRAIVKNLPYKTFHSGFSLSFDKDSNVQIRDVKFNNNPAQYSFQNNSLEISFDEGKINNEILFIEYSYLHNSKKVDKYLRQEFVKAPAWTKGAKARVTLEIPRDFHVVSLNPQLRKMSNRMIYEGTVPQGGFSNLVRLTPKKTIWDVSIKKIIRSKTNLVSLTATIPIYFEDGGQRVDGNITTSSPNPVSGKKGFDTYSLKYSNIIDNKVDIEVNANVYGGRIEQKLVERNPKDYLIVNQNDWLVLSKTLAQIKDNKELRRLPLYAKIGHFVHNYIEYDRKYIGKLFDNSTILSLKKGVCTEYARLYNTLARMAGIPSIIINGIAKGEYNKFEGHSWNMIYVNNRWQQVDPTWNLMSGNVSSSHIYFYDNGVKSMEVNWSANNGAPKDNVSLKTDFSAREVSR